MSPHPDPPTKPAPTDRRYLFPAARVCEDNGVFNVAYLTFTACLFSIAAVGDPQLWIGQRPVASIRKVWLGLLEAFGERVPPHVHCAWSDASGNLPAVISWLANLPIVTPAHTLLAMLSRLLALNRWHLKRVNRLSRPELARLMRPYPKHLRYDFLQRALLWALFRRQTHGPTPPPAVFRSCRRSSRSLATEERRALHCHPRLGTSCGRAISRRRRDPLRDAGRNLRTALLISLPLHLTAVSACSSGPPPPIAVAEVPAADPDAAFDSIAASACVDCTDTHDSIVAANPDTSSNDPRDMQIVALQQLDAALWDSNRHTYRPAVTLAPVPCMQATLATVNFIALNIANNNSALALLDVIARDVRRFADHRPLLLQGCLPFREALVVLDGQTHLREDDVRTRRGAFSGALTSLRQMFWGVVRGAQRVAPSGARGAFSNAYRTISNLPAWVKYSAAGVTAATSLGGVVLIKVALNTEPTEYPPATTTSTEPSYYNLPNLNGKGNRRTGRRRRRRVRRSDTLALNRRLNHTLVSDYALIDGVVGDRGMIQFAANHSASTAVLRSSSAAVQAAVRCAYLLQTSSFSLGLEISARRRAIIACQRDVLRRLRAHSRRRRTVEKYKERLSDPAEVRKRRKQVKDILKMFKPTHSSLEYPGITADNIYKPCLHMCGGRHGGCLFCGGGGLCCRARERGGGCDGNLGWIDKHRCVQTPLADGTRVREDHKCGDYSMFVKYHGANPGFVDAIEHKGFHGNRYHVVQCDPHSEFPCCSPWGWCGKTDQHCSGKDNGKPGREKYSIDYREVITHGDMRAFHLAIDLLRRYSDPVHENYQSLQAALAVIRADCPLESGHFGAVLTILRARLFIYHRVWGGDRAVEQNFDTEIKAEDILNFELPSEEMFDDWATHADGQVAIASTLAFARTLLPRLQLFITAALDSGAFGADAYDGDFQEAQRVINLLKGDNYLTCPDRQLLLIDFLLRDLDVDDGRDACPSRSDDFRLDNPVCRGTAYLTDNIEFCFKLDLAATSHFTVQLAEKQCVDHTSGALSTYREYLTNSMKSKLLLSYRLSAGLPARRRNRRSISAVQALRSYCRFMDGWLGRSLGLDIICLIHDSINLLSGGSHCWSVSFDTVCNMSDEEKPTHEMMNFIHLPVFTTELKLTKASLESYLHPADTDCAGRNIDPNSDQCFWHVIRRCAWAYLHIAQGIDVDTFQAVAPPACQPAIFAWFLRGIRSDDGPPSWDVCTNIFPSLADNISNNKITYSEEITRLAGIGTENCVSNCESLPFDSLYQLTTSTGGSACRTVLSGTWFRYARQINPNWLRDVQHLPREQNISLEDPNALSDLLDGKIFSINDMPPDVQNKMLNLPPTSVDVMRNWPKPSPGAFNNGPRPAPSSTLFPLCIAAALRGKLALTLLLLPVFALQTLANLRLAHPNWDLDDGAQPGQPHQRAPCRRRRGNDGSGFESSPSEVRIEHVSTSAIFHSIIGTSAAQHHFEMLRILIYDTSIEQSFALLQQAIEHEFVHDHPDAEMPKMGEWLHDTSIPENMALLLARRDRLQMRIASYGAFKEAVSTSHSDIIRYRLRPAMQPPSKRDADEPIRTIRQILAVAGAAIISTVASMLMSTISDSQLTALHERFTTVKDTVTASLSDLETMADTVEGLSHSVQKFYKVFSRQNKFWGHTILWNDMFAQTEAVIDTHMDIIGAAAANTLHPSVISQIDVVDVTRKLADLSATDDLMPVVESPADYISLETSLSLLRPNDADDYQGFQILVRLPLIRPEAQLTLFRVHPVPIRLADGSFLLLTPDEDLIVAVTTKAGNERAHWTTIPASDLAQCRQCKKHYLCSSVGALRPPLEDDDGTIGLDPAVCAYALFAGLETLALASCKTRSIHEKALAVQLSAFQFAVFVKDNSELTVVCPSDSGHIPAQVQRVNSLALVHLPAGCRASVAGLRLFADDSIHAGADDLVYRIHVDDRLGDTLAARAAEAASQWKSDVTNALGNDTHSQFSQEADRAHVISEAVAGRRKDLEQDATLEFHHHRSIGGDALLLFLVLALTTFLLIVAVYLWRRCRGEWPLIRRLKGPSSMLKHMHQVDLRVNTMSSDMAENSLRIKELERRLNMPVRPPAHVLSSIPFWADEQLNPELYQGQEPTARRRPSRRRPDQLPIHSPFSPSSPPDDSDSSIPLMEYSDNDSAVRRAAARPGQWPQNVASALGGSQISGERCALPVSGAEDGLSDNDGPHPPADDDGGPPTPPVSPSNGGQEVAGAGRGRGATPPVPAGRPGVTFAPPGSLARSPAPVIPLKPAGHR